VSVEIWVRRWTIGIVKKGGPTGRLSWIIMRRIASRSGVAVQKLASGIELLRGDDRFILPDRQFMLIPYVAANFDLFFTAVHPDSVEGALKTVDFSTPGEHRLVEPAMTIEMPSFPDRLDFESEYFHWFTPGEGDTVFDLGANIGIATLVLADRVGRSGRVIAVEPDPQTFHYLERNIARYDLPQVTLLQCAVSDCDGTATFFAEGSMFSGLQSARKDAVFRESIGSTIEVPTRTLRSLVAEFGDPTFIKMDIEGAEIEAFDGAAAALASRPAIACETNHIRGSTRTQFAVEEALRGMGYIVETGCPGGSYITWAR
jgi:FkbM family methyltransferase